MSVQIMYLAKSMEMFSAKSSSEAPALPPSTTEKRSSHVALTNAASESAATPSSEAEVSATSPVESAVASSSEAEVSATSPTFTENSSNQPSDGEVKIEESSSDEDVENYFG